MSSWTAIVTCLALLLYAVFGMRVARARVKYNIQAPATTGHPIFERTFRIQSNTTEQLIIFLPSLWLFSAYVSPIWASLVGIVWIAGRVIYAISYTRDPERRAVGFVTGYLATVFLLMGSLFSIVWQQLR